MSAPVGRGALTLGSLVPEVTDTVRLPPLTLAASAPPVNAVISMNAALYPKDFTLWSEFHNGVAAALRLRSGMTHLTRSWVRQHEEARPSAGTAGLLFGFGLRGILSSLRVGDVYSYLRHRHDYTNIAVLLGAAAAAAGTMDTSLSKILRLYLPSLIPGASVNDTVHVTLQVQSAVLVGVGLLYRGSAHRLMTEFLVREIGRRATADIRMQECYSLSAGLALGLVTLGKGGSGDAAGFGVADLRLLDRLRAYMNGSVSGEPRGGAGDAAGVGANDTDTIHHGAGINVAVAAPGATIALGLMFIDTGEQTAAAALWLPDTIGELGALAPECIILRVVCRCLVLPGYVRPSARWVSSQIPDAVKMVMRHHVWASNSRQGGRLLAAWLGLPLQRPGGSTAFMRAFHPLDQFTVRTSFFTAVAGACMAIGLRYAGTADREARDVLMRRLRMLQCVRNRGRSQTKAAAGGAPGTLPPLRGSQVDRVASSRATVEMCCGTVALALALVMAGTGEVATMRLLRELRNKVDISVSYGHHMAYNMALGFLFLHGGSATFARTPEAISALMCALYPRFPNFATDCQYHLQALRHLYVLAVDHRSLSVRDIDTGEEVYCPVAVVPRDGDITSVRVVAPCLLPQFELGATVIVDSPRYWPYSLNLDRDLLTALQRGFDGATTFSRQRGIANIYGRTLGKAGGGSVINKRGGVLLWVQRKSAQLSYQQDPQGRRSLVARAFPDAGAWFACGGVLRCCACARRAHKPRALPDGRCVWSRPVHGGWQGRVCGSLHRGRNHARVCATPVRTSW